MGSASTDTIRREAEPGNPLDATLPEVVPTWQRLPVLPLALTILFLGFVALPRVRENPRLAWTIAGIAAGLSVWTLVLWAGAKRWTQCFRIEWVPGLKSHYVQASVQICVYLYWGWHWRDVYREAPLILSQLVFLYTFDGLLTWSRGRRWRLGFGPLPIVLSTNVFIWFKDDWYVFQFLLVALGALGKEFIKWNRDGRRTHVFNPSAFTLFVFSIVLIATGTTRYTWGVEIATTLAAPPHIYLEVFLLGLVVQYLFSVTLMTFSAALALWALNLAYKQITGTYQFVDTNIPIAIFLGLHLLVTDPSTSPRTNAGKVIFGGLYGLGNFVLYTVFERIGVPEFYDKLLPVPILNLSVQWIDRLAKTGILGTFSRWEAKFQPRKLNLVHMGCWAALFTAMLGAGYVEGSHEGTSIAFWKKAYEEGKPGAGPKLFKVVGAQALQDSGAACNELGMIYMQGKLTKKDHAAAAHYFARACELGDPDGCANLATQFLYLREARSDQDVARALHRLEQECGTEPDGRSCYLIGLAYERGMGRGLDRRRACDLYEEGCRRGSLEACKGLARMRCQVGGEPADLKSAAEVLEKGCESGDAESCLYLGYIYRGGFGVQRDGQKAVALIGKACTFGSGQACEALKYTDLPPLSVPDTTLVPGWRGGLRSIGG